jgi:hypothetical protein
LEFSNLTFSASSSFNESYGLPAMEPVPNGLVPLLEIWGKGKPRFPLLVQMNHPITWVVTLPSNDLNGEGGTIQAGEYAKGDTATLFVYQDEGHVDVCANLVPYTDDCAMQTYT